MANGGFPRLAGGYPWCFLIGLGRKIFVVQRDAEIRRHDRYEENSK